MSKLIDMDFPQSSSVKDRVQWANARYNELCKDKLTREQGQFVKTMIIGWTDLCSEAERKEYLALYKAFSALLAR